MTTQTATMATGFAAPVAMERKGILGTKLGMTQVFADDGDRVTKGMVVARLRSDLEQASLDLAKARAETTAIIELSRERANLLKKEVDRVTQLHAKQIAATAQFDKSLSELQQAILQLRQAETEQEFAVLHGLDDEAAHAGDSLLQYGTFLQRPIFFAC